MAARDWSLGSFNSDSVRAWFTYDDVTRVIQSVSLENDGPFGNVTLTLSDPVTNLVIYGPQTRGFATGFVTQDIANLGLLMVVTPPGPKGGGPGLAPPFNAQMGWSSV